MGLKVRQALEAGATIMREPLHIPAVARFLDAVMDTRAMRALYARLVDGLPAEELARLRELTARPLVLAELERLPAETLGGRYAAFARRNGFTCNNVEAQIAAHPPIAALLEKDWIFRRFVKLHDLEHVLTGFQTDPAAEVGLQLFNFRNYGEPFGLSALLCLPLAIARYGQPVEMARACWLGWERAAGARNLFRAPIEEWLGLELREVQRRLNLPEETELRERPA